MDLNKIGSFLKELRKEKGYTQQDVADELYVSAKSVSRWENGDGIPDIDTISELAKFYQISVDELLNGEKKGETVLKNLTHTSKILREKLISKMNAIFITSLSVCGGLFLLGVILGLLFEYGLIFILLLVGIISGLIIYYCGYNEIKRKAKMDEELSKDDLFYIEHFLKLKTRFFKHFIICFTAILLFVLFITTKLANMAIIGVSSFLVMYFLLNVGYKEESMLKRTRKVALIMMAVVTILYTICSFTISYSKDTTSIINPNGDTYMIVYAIDCFNYGYQTLKLISIILFVGVIIGSFLIIFFQFKFKVFVLIGLIILGFVSNILPIIDLQIYHSVWIITDRVSYTIPGIYILANFIAYLIIYFIAVYKERKKLI